MNSLSPREHNHIVTPEEFNAQCVNTLRSSKVGEGDYVVVVGAGPSSPLIPAGTKLREEMARACSIENPPNKPFWDFFEEAKKNKPQEYCRVIEATFNDPPFWSSDAYDLITRIRFKSIITTNYDQYLPKAFQNTEGRGWNERFCIYPPRKGADSTGVATALDIEDQKCLIAIHGYCDSSRSGWPMDSIILAKSDYILHYFDPQSAYYLHSWWKEILGRFNCIFIGSSLVEPGISHVFRTLVRDKFFERKSRRHIHLVDTHPVVNTIDESSSYPEPEILFGVVQQVFYDPKKSYVGLLDVLSGFSDIPICTTFEPKMKAPSITDFDR